MKFIHRILLALCLFLNAPLFAKDKNLVYSPKKSKLAISVPNKPENTKKKLTSKSTDYTEKEKATSHSESILALETDSIEEDSSGVILEDLFDDSLATAPLLPDTVTLNLNEAHMPCETPRITSPYGIRRYRMHKGIDVKVAIGDTIRAAFSGVVSRVSYERRGYGHFIFIEHEGQVISTTVYAHLSKKLVKVGQEVLAGEVIGLGGNSGRSTGSHLHFETRIEGKAVNPIYFFDFENNQMISDSLVLSLEDIRSEIKSIETELAKHRYHRIRPGDTLSKIARKYGTSIDKICRLNGIKRTTILRIGRVLRCS